MLSDLRYIYSLTITVADRLRHWPIFRIGGGSIILKIKVFLVDQTSVSDQMALWCPATEIYG
jgi:hypothetical protein